MYSLHILILIYLAIISSFEKELSNFDRQALSSIGNFTKNILPIKGKTNKTKCIAKKYIKQNEIIFSYPQSEVISSSQIDFPKMNEMENFINDIIDDSLKTNRILMTIYFILETQNNNSKIGTYFSLFSFESFNNSKIYWNKEDYYDFSISFIDANLQLQDIETIKQLFNYLATNFTLKITNIELYLKAYYYINHNSFILNNSEIVIFPYLDICNIYPLFLSNNNFNLGKIPLDNNTIYIEFFNESYLIRANRKYSIKETFFFFYDKKKLSNNFLLSNLGLVIKNNYYNNIPLSLDFKFKNSTLIKGFIDFINKKKFNTSNINYTIDKPQNIISFNLYLKDIDFKQKSLNLLSLYYQFLLFLPESHPTITILTNNYNFYLWKFIRKQISKIIIQINHIDDYISQIKTSKREISKLTHLYTLENILQLTKYQHNLYTTMITNLWRKIVNHGTYYYN